MSLFEAVIIAWLIAIACFPFALWFIGWSSNRTSQAKPIKFNPDVVEYAKKKVTYYGTYRGGEVRKACQYYQKEYDEGRLKLPVQAAQSKSPISEAPAIPKNNINIDNGTKSRTLHNPTQS